MPRFCLFLAPVAMLATGCASLGRAVPGNAVVVFGLTAMEFGLMAHRLDESEERVVVIHEPASEPPVFALAPDEPKPKEDKPPRPFDVGGAHAALAKVEPQSCWGEKAPPGYAKARITFAPSGEVSLIEIANVRGAPDPDKDCIADKYREARVSPFEGAPVAVSTSVYVGPPQERAN